MAEFMFLLELENTREGDEAERALTVAIDLEKKSGSVRLMERTKKGGEVIVAKKKITSQEFFKMVAGPLGQLHPALKAKLGLD
jgi:hypothetical protein